MDLKVTLTLSDRLFELLEDKLPSLGKRVARTVSKELRVMAKEEVKASIEVAPTPAPEPEPEPEPKKLTEADVRDAMHRMRARFIEGYDRENTDTDSETYKKYFKQLQEETAAIIMETTRGKSKRMADIPAEVRALAIEAFDSVQKGDAGELLSHAPIKL